MNTLPPEDEDLSEVDALYRRAAATVAGGPAEPVRERVLAHAKQLALRTQFEATEKPAYSWQRPPRRAWRRPATFGALAAALLAVFMWTPRRSAPPAVARLDMPAPQAAPARSRADSPADGSPVFADIDAAPATAASPVAAHAAPAAQGGRAAAKVPIPATPVIVAQNRTGADAAANAEARDRLGTARSSAATVAAAAAPATSAASGSVAPASLAAPGAAGPALWRAAQSGDLPALRGLHQQQVDLDLRDPAGRTALMIATLNGHSQAVALLLDAGANPNIADASGESPLDAALAADESEIIAALKRHGGR